MPRTAPNNRNLTQDCRASRQVSPTFADEARPAKAVFVREPNPSQPLLLLPDAPAPVLPTHVQSLRQGIWASREVRPDADEHAEGEQARLQPFAFVRASPGRLSQATTDGGPRPVSAITRCSFSPIANRRRYHRRPGPSLDGGKPSANNFFFILASFCQCCRTIASQHLPPSSSLRPFAIAAMTWRMARGLAQTARRRRGESNCFKLAATRYPFWERYSFTLPLEVNSEHKKPSLRFLRGSRMTVSALARGGLKISLPAL